MPHKFDDDLVLSADGGVLAEGPKDPGDELLEVCAWVYQRGECDSQLQRGDNDAAATEMTTCTDKPELKTTLMTEAGVPGTRWELPLEQIGDFALEEGPAFAIAVSLLKNPEGKQRLVWWGHPVRLGKAKSGTTQVGPGA